MNQAHHVCQAPSNCSVSFAQQTNEMPNLGWHRRTPFMLGSHTCIGRVLGACPPGTHERDHSHIFVKPDHIHRPPCCSDRDLSCHMPQAAACHGAPGGAVLGSWEPSWQACCCLCFMFFIQSRHSYQRWTRVLFAVLMLGTCPVMCRRPTCCCAYLHSPMQSHNSETPAVSNDAADFADDLAWGVLPPLA